MGDKHVDFTECPWVKQQIKPFPGSQFSLLVLFGHGFLTTHLQDLAFPLFEILNFIFNDTHIRFLS